MPYLRLTCPETGPQARGNIAETLTTTLVELFTPPRGPSREDVRARTTVHFACYQAAELFVGGSAAEPDGSDITAELSDWSMSTRQQRRVAAELTPLLVRLFNADPDSVNIRFHSYPPTNFAVGGRLLSDRIPTLARLAKRIIG